MSNIVADSTTTLTPALKATHFNKGNAVSATSNDGIGVFAQSQTNTAVYASSGSGIGIQTSSTYRAIHAENNGTHEGIFVMNNSGGTGISIQHNSNTGQAIYAHSADRSYSGYLIESSAKKCIAAVYGHTEKGCGVQGVSVGSSARGSDVGVLGSSTNGHGVIGRSSNGEGVNAEGGSCGIHASSTSGIGGHIYSTSGIGVEASSKSNTALFAHSASGWGVDARSTTGIGVRASGGQYAGYFDGIVMVTGDIQLKNADCAEAFDVHVHAAQEIEPGTVMVIDPEGMMCPSTKAYDRCVAGVTSGAGDLKPGLILGKDPEKTSRLPIALIGKVYCKVDADFGAIEMGDMLTTSSTPGHAMKASDPAQAFGAVIGKALKPCASGKALIPILVALQ